MLGVHHSVLLGGTIYHDLGLGWWTNAVSRWIERPRTDAHVLAFAARGSLTSACRPCVEREPVRCVTTTSRTYVGARQVGGGVATSEQVGLVGCRVEQWTAGLPGPDKIVSCSKSLRTRGYGKIVATLERGFATA